jgi:hypothetical protein
MAKDNDVEPEPNETSKSLAAQGGRNVDDEFEKRLTTVRGGLLARYRWLIFVLPLAVFMLLGSLEPAPPSSRANAADTVAESDQETEDQGDEAESWIGVGYRHYPYLYSLRIAITVVAVWFVLPGYLQFPLRVSPLSIGVGVVGIVIWVGLCHFDLESKVLPLLGLGLGSVGERVAFDPLQQLGGRPVLLAAFLFVRFIGLAAVVPLIEEFFLRGFLMRFVMDQQWWNVPFGQTTTLAIIVGTGYGVLSHPAELLAAAAWFSLVTWLMIRTRNIWDCVVAHAVTNLLLGVYVLVSRDWSLW